MGFSGFYHKKYFHRPIWPKPIFLYLGRFGYKKASKMQKFLFFQNLQNLSFLSICTLLGIFPVDKKLYTFESQLNPFYLFQTKVSCVKQAQFSEAIRQPIFLKILELCGSFFFKIFFAILSAMLQMFQLMTSLEPFYH